MSDFDADAYWASREWKKWVVDLESGPRRKPRRETRYICARTHERAVACAKGETFMTRPRVVWVRLATPRDLGCVPGPAIKPLIQQIEERARAVQKTIA